MNEILPHKTIFPGRWMNFCQKYGLTATRSGGQFMKKNYHLHEEYLASLKKYVPFGGTGHGGIDIDFCMALG